MIDYKHVKGTNLIRTLQISHILMQLGLFAFFNVSVIVVFCFSVTCDTRNSLASFVMLDDKPLPSKDVALLFGAKC